MINKTVAILGASNNEERYANRAQKRLVEHGYRVIPVSPTGREILGIAGIKSLRDIHETVDTVTLYVGPKNLQPQLADLIALKPRRVICNPGTEDLAMQQAMRDAGIHVIDACTLVLLSTGQFESA